MLRYFFWLSVYGALLAVVKLSRYWYGVRQLPTTSRRIELARRRRRRRRHRLFNDSIVVRTRCDRTVARSPLFPGIKSHNNFLHVSHQQKSAAPQSENSVHKLSTIRPSSTVCRLQAIKHVMIRAPTRRRPDNSLLFVSAYCFWLNYTLFQYRHRRHATEIHI